jgi:hypothetical protein
MGTGPDFSKVVMIFWGPSFANPAGSQTPGAIAGELNAMVSQFGTTGEYNTITQYSGIQQTNLFSDYWIDPANPPRGGHRHRHPERGQELHQHRARALDQHKRRLRGLPAQRFYSTSGGSNSCGRPNLQYCACGNFTFNNKDVKYGSMPYPSCGGCQWTGWTTAELRALHLPRDPRGGDRSRSERLV